jgi:tetratricopeptide (TPR) repeat protein
MSDVSADRSLRWYFAREPLILLVLTTLAVIFFLAVSALSKVYQARRESLAEDWFKRAVTDQQAGHLDRAVHEFQAAELYSRDNFVYQLSLAQTLEREGNIDEAYSYLLNLRERQPDNGTVNLELARILAKEKESSQAIRYYHNALYAVWPIDPEEHRQTVRFELIKFLLRQNATAQAQSELIALAASLPKDPDLHTRVAALFLDTQDYEHALAEYRDALETDRHNAAALAGAGHASYELAMYPLARRYLQAAVAANPTDAESSNLLQTATLVLKMDPYRRQISVSDRNRAVIDAFNTAGERLKTCPLPEAAGSEGSTDAKAAQPPLATQWKEMQPKMTAGNLRRDPDLVETAMDLIFAVEQQTNSTCGTPTGKDLALLLVSKLHEGSER